MRPTILVLAAALAALAYISQPGAASPAAGPPWCLPATDTAAVRFADFLVKIGSSSGLAEVRRSINLPVTPADQISLVSDEELCRRAVQARDSVNAGVASVPKGEPLYLARFGTMYAAYPPNHHGGEWGTIDFFDNTFTFVVGLAH
ncbi:MAG: hypothetical protein WKG32_11850 [Gemmatimonadaceae bacterium]